ncbi:MAG TPA: hypothetical protein VIQ03_13590 [Gammaproteobacteria bacterium]
MNKNHDYKIEQIVLAFDSSGYSHITIEHIVNIASHLKSTIQAIYIEDNNLLNAAGLPFTREVTLHTAQTRKLDTQQITRHFNNLASQIRNMLETQASLANIQSSFRVTRGPKIQTILQESLHAQLVFLPAASRIIQTKKQKFVAVAIDGQNDMISLRLSAVLARKFELDLLVISEKAIELPDDVHEFFRKDYPNIRFRQIQTDNPATLINQLKYYAVEILVIPETHFLLKQPDKIQRIINSLNCDVLVTRSQPTNNSTH